jgi:hypothetical protein
MAYFIVAMLSSMEVAVGLSVTRNNQGRYVTKSVFYNMRYASRPRNTRAPVPRRIERRVGIITLIYETRQCEKYRWLSVMGTSQTYVDRAQGVHCAYGTVPTPELIAT